MEAASVKRENRDIFRQVTLVVESLVTPKFHIKRELRPCLGADLPLTLRLPLSKYPIFLLKHLIIGNQRAGVKHIANFAVLPNADRKK